MTASTDSIAETNRETAPAKLNLFLEIVGRRPDGFHDLASVFHEIPALADTLTGQPDDDGIHLTVEGAPELAAGPDNLVWRAFAALRRATGARGGVRARLIKRVPTAMGLGGGSSDAAAALRLGNRLWGCGLSREELAEIGAGLGSDVPFFLYGGTCLCEGRGERVTPLPEAARTLAAWPLVLIAPPWRISTAAAFKHYAERGASERRRPAAPFIAALAEGDRELTIRLAFNRFETVAEALCPRQGKLRRALAEAGLPGPWLSGSGPALWSFATGDRRLATGRGQSNQKIS